MKPINLSFKQYQKIHKYLISSNYSVDNAYMEMVREYKLWGEAYYGFTATPYKRRLLTHLWRGVLFSNLENNPNLREWQKQQTQTFLNIKQL